MSVDRKSARFKPSPHTCQSCYTKDITALCPKCGSTYEYVYTWVEADEVDWVWQRTNETVRKMSS